MKIISLEKLCGSRYLLGRTVVWLRGPVAGSGVSHPDWPAGAARPLGSPAEERVEEGVGHGLRHEHHQEGYHLQGTQR